MKKPKIAFKTKWGNYQYTGEGTYTFLEYKNTNNRKWILTINNPTETDEKFYIYLKNLPNIEYAIFQREFGNKEKTEHFQLFVIFKNYVPFQSIKEYFPKAHIEKVWGTNEQACNYCKKQETKIGKTYEIGKIPE